MPSRSVRYGAASLGALLGAALLGLPLAFVAMLLITYIDPSLGEGMMPLGVLSGVTPPALWLGAIAGCWLALRQAETTGAARTAALLGLLLPLGVALMASQLESIVLPFLLLIVGLALLSRTVMELVQL